MGVSKTTGLRGYMALYTKKGAKVSAGEKVSVLFDIDGQKFTGDATGAQLAGFDGAFRPFQQSRFYLRSCEEEIDDNHSERA